MEATEVMLRTVVQRRDGGGRSLGLILHVLVCMMLTYPMTATSAGVSSDLKMALLW